MKRLLSFVFIVITFLNSCTEIDPITNLTINSAQVTIGVGENYTISVTHTPGDLPAPTYIWSSQSPSIVSVDANGVIKGISVGTTKITAASQNNSNLTATCTVTVKMRGEADFPYLINSIIDLKSIRDSINNGNTKFTSFSYKLIADLDFSNENYWEPISNKQNLSFKGVFDGNGKKIKNIKIGTENTQVTYSSGFFGYISGGKVLNLTIDWICINSSNSVGGIAVYSENGTTIDNCHTSGLINGRYYSGGIIAISNDTEIKNSSSIRSTNKNVDSSDTYNGGIVAKASDTRINSCYSKGDLSSYYCGGIVGMASNGTTVSDCHSTGNLTSLGGLYPSIGGIVGEGSKVIINNCYSTGNLNSNGGYGFAGGIAGNINGEIYNSYSKGVIYSDKFSGGIAGNLVGKVYNCYSTGAISSICDGSPYSGGIVGNLIGIISNCYSTGNIYSKSRSYEYTSESYAGGICGLAGFYQKIAEINYCIALNKEVATYGYTSNQIYNNQFSSRIANYYDYKSTANKNYAYASMVVKEQSSIINTSNDRKSNGDNLVGNPVDLLNAYVSDNGTINGITLQKWKVDTNLNNGFPIFQ